MIQKNRIQKHTEAMPVVEQVRKSFHKKNRLAMICGFLLGSFVPIAAYVLGHFETKAEPMMWIVVTAGLIYSATTVFQWAKVAFKNPLKALGFCILIEGVMTFSQTQALALAGLALLVIINGIATGTILALDQRGNQARK